MTKLEVMVNFYTLQPFEYASNSKEVLLTRESIKDQVQEKPTQPGAKPKGKAKAGGKGQTVH